MPAAAVDLTGLHAGYGPTRIIEGIDVQVPAGGTLAVLGRNGAGKTTLLASLVGHARRHAGRIALGGVDVTAWTTQERARLGLGYVPQTRDVFPSLTVAENLFVGLNGRPRHRIEEAYALFPRLRERQKTPARLLSGGEQQMLSIARAILGDPGVLLLDEPLEGLAPVVCDQVMDAIRQFTGSERMTVVLVEQQVGRALSVAGQAMLMERGRVAWAGGVAELRAQPHLVERYVGVGP